jgi:hypothetical protein
VTIRDFLAARRRKLMILAFVSWVGFALTGVVFAAQYQTLWLTFLFFAMFGAAVMLHMFWLRCPRCAGPVGMTNLRFTGGTGVLTRRMDFCPYCGVSLDESCEKPSVRQR